MSTITWGLATLDRPISAQGGFKSYWDRVAAAFCFPSSSQALHALTPTMPHRIYYSDKYYDEKYEYRWGAEETGGDYGRALEDRDACVFRTSYELRLSFSWRLVFRVSVSLFCFFSSIFVTLSFYLFFPVDLKAICVHLFSSLVFSSFSCSCSSFLGIRT